MALKLKQLNIDTVAEFVRRVNAIRDRWIQSHKGDDEWGPWFRGESRADSTTTLLPRLYRNDHRSMLHLLNLEQELRLEFKRCGVQLAPGIKPADHWDWYFMMQHYGAPTRLLDWTDGALIGLFFAIMNRIRKPIADEQDAAVYMLDPWWLNEQAFKPNREGWEGVALTDWKPAAKYLSKNELDNYRLRGGLPLAIDPAHLSSRLSAQRSRFILFTRDKNGLSKVSMRPDVRLLRIRVPGKAIPEIWDDLRSLGVSRASIFPELQGLGDDLSDWFDRRLSLR